MVNTLAILEKPEILEKLNNGKEKKLCHRRSPQLGYPEVELRHHEWCRYRNQFRGGKDDYQPALFPHKIVLAEKIAIQAVMVMMMRRFDVSDTLQTIVVDINCLMMHM